MAAGHLLPRVQARVKDLLGGYPDAASLRDRIEDYIARPRSATGRACSARWRWPVSAHRAGISLMRGAHWRRR